MKKKKYYAAQLLIKIDNKRSQEEMFPEQLFFLGTFIIR